MCLSAAFRRIWGAQLLSLLSGRGGKLFCWRVPAVLSSLCWLKSKPRLSLQLIGCSPVILNSSAGFLAVHLHVITCYLQKVTKQLNMKVEGNMKAAENYSPALSTPATLICIQLSSLF